MTKNCGTEIIFKDQDFTALPNEKPYPYVVRSANIIRLVVEVVVRRCTSRIR